MCAQGKSHLNFPLVWCGFHEVLTEKEKLLQFEIMNLYVHLYIFMYIVGNNQKKIPSGCL